MKHKEIFTEIYDKNVWGGSGGGSMPERTIEYRALLQKFLRDEKITTVIDFGAGDWMFSHLIDWSNVYYTGIDCVQSVIDNNLSRYAKDNITFACRDNVGNHIGDLLILKDVLQHWDSKTITEFLDVQTTRFKYILITNNSNQIQDSFITEMPTTQDLNANFLPLKKYNPEILLDLGEPEMKQVCLIERK